MQAIELQKVKLRSKILRGVALFSVAIAPFRVASLLIVTGHEVLSHPIVEIGAFIGIFVLGLELGKHLEMRLYGDILQALILDINFMDQQDAMMQ